MRYWMITIATFITDGIIKNKVEKQLKAGETLPVFHGKILLRRFHNTGAMLSIGEKKQKEVAGIAVLFTVFMSGVFVATLGYKGKGLLKTGLALILGGAYSNTYDRILRKFVVDYISFPVKNKKLRNIIFNISDFAIMIGALFMLLSGLSEEN